MHIEARLEASRQPSPTPWLRRASRANASPHETSAETLDDPWPSAGLRRPRPRAADPLRCSEEHHRQADARPRHASRGTAATQRPGATPRRVLHRATVGATRSLAGPFVRPFDPAAIRRSPRRLDQRRPSEDDQSLSRACLRAPGPHRSTNRTPPPRRTKKRGRRMRQGPADRSARRRDVRRPRRITETSPPLASQPSELITAGHRPRSASPKRCLAPPKPDSELCGYALAPTGGSPPSSEEPSGGVCHRHRAPCAQPACLDRASRPRRDELPAQAAGWPLRSPLPNVRATSGLRRARRRGAERSERPRLSPSSTPGRSLEPEGSSSRQGCRIQTRGAPPKPLQTLGVTPKNHTSSRRRQHLRTG